MLKKFKLPVGAAALLILVSGFLIPADRYFEIARSLDIFSTLFKEVNANYVDEVDPYRLAEKGIGAMLESLDPYTTFIPEESAEAFSIQTTGQYAGIGALVVNLDKKVLISQPYIDFPAHRAGVRVGDEIVAVDGKSVENLPVSAVTTMLKGAPKTQVEVVFNRPGEKKEIKLLLTRERIKVTNIAWYGMVDEQTGYIGLAEFTTGAGREIQEAIRQMKKSGMKNLILDLRDNPGGLLHEAVNIVGLFIPKGSEVVKTKGRLEDFNKTYKTLSQPEDLELPVAVLVSNGSASASEIVAGALQDYDRAVLVGQKTFGKGLVQTTRSLSYNAQLKVTTARYYIPSGRCIQALNYASKNEQGEAQRNADSLKQAFKTAGGRIVYDGGGLDPDVTTENIAAMPILAQLAGSGLMFLYAREFCGVHPAPADFRKFSLNDAQYSDFTAWLKKRGFTYQTELDVRLKELEALAVAQESSGDLLASVVQLKNNLQTAREELFIKHRKTISEFLEEEIAFHYRLEEGRVLSSLKSDKELLMAKKLFSDPVSFSKILSGHGAYPGR